MDAYCWIHSTVNPDTRQRARIFCFPSPPPKTNKRDNYPPPSFRTQPDPQAQHPAQDPESLPGLPLQGRQGPGHPVLPVGPLLPALPGLAAFRCTCGYSYNRNLTAEQRNLYLCKDFASGGLGDKKLLQVLLYHARFQLTIMC